MIYILEDFSQITFGGGQRFTLEILRACAHIGKCFYVYHLGSSSVFKERLLNSQQIIDHIKFFKLSDSSKPFGRFYFFVSLILCILSNPPSIYLSCTKFCTVVLILISFLPGAYPASKFILFHHLAPPSNLIISIIYSIAFKSSRFTNIYSSKYLSSLYHCKYGLPSKHYVSPTPCVQLPMRHSDTKIVPLIQSQTFLQTDIIFGYIGMIHPSKGLFQLIDLFSTFKTQCPSHNFCLKIYGTGPDVFLAKLFSVIQSSNLSIQFYGSIETTQQVFSELTCLFVPSWNLLETLCFTALEGIAFSQFVLLSPTGVLEEYVDNPNVSFISSNPIEFCETLDQLLSNISTRRQFLGAKILVGNSSAFVSFWSSLLSSLY